MRKFLSILYLAVWYVLLFTSSCGATPIQKLDLMLQARTSDGSAGWCAPIGPELVVTAAHVAAHPLVYCGGVLVRTIAVDKDHDFAVMRAPDDSYSRWYRIRKQPPVPGERLYWRLYLPALHPAVTSGLVMGEDDFGFHHIDGIAIPGASGSGVLDENGDLVGVISAAWNTNPKDGIWRSTVIVARSKEILR